MSIGYAGAPIDPATARMMAARRPRALELTPVGLPALRELIERFITVGFSKFVVRHSQSARRAVALPRGHQYRRTAECLASSTKATRKGFIRR